MCTILSADQHHLTHITMPYINCGVRETKGFQWVKTKARLKGLVANDPASVIIENTSPMGAQYSGFLSEAPTNMDYHFTAVGPDPYSKRNWYATISFRHTSNNPEGKWVVT